MSKMDAMRAMREARYAESVARGRAAAPQQPPRPDAARRTARPAAGPATDAAAAPVSASAGADAAEQLCGHRAISGKTCTREQGHAAKSHRYA